MMNIFAILFITWYF